MDMQENHLQLQHFLLGRGRWLRAVYPCAMLYAKLR